MVGYYPSWDAYQRLKPRQIAADFLTHVNYAFATVSPDGLAIVDDPCADIGQCGTTRPATGRHAPGENFSEMLRLKQAHPDLKVLLAIGGWKDRYVSQTLHCRLHHASDLSGLRSNCFWRNGPTYSTGSI